MSRTGNLIFTILLKQIPTEPNFYWDAIKNPLHRSAINKFRLGNHLLRIETGRYTAPKTPEDLRICFICQANEVKNESHVICFLALCMIHFATIFFDETINKYYFFNDLGVKSKILFLFNNIDPFICKPVAVFIFEIMNRRHYHVISKVN